MMATTTETSYAAVGTSSSVEGSMTAKLIGSTLIEYPICDVLPRRAASVASSHSDAISSATLDVGTSDDMCASCSGHSSTPSNVETPMILPSTSSPERAASTIEHNISLPFELYRPIFAFVADPRDLRNLAVASRITQPDAERFLHASVSAFGIRDVTGRCRHLARFPRVAAFTRRIVFRDLADKTWPSCQPLASFFSLVETALRNTPKLAYLDASILPTTSLPTNVPFRLKNFVHDGLVIGLDAVNFFTEQTSIEHLILNPFSYYELHEDDEHYRRLLYTILPNLRSVSCGLSVAIRLVESRPLERFVVPWRQDCLDSDQLERLVRALSSRRGRPDRSHLKSLIVERRFAGREGLRCITKHLKGLEHLGLVVSYASEWLSDLSGLKSLQSLSLMGDSFFDSHDEKLALDKLRVCCPSLSSVFIQENSTQRVSQLQSLSYSPADIEAQRTSSSNSSSTSSLVTLGGAHAMLADHWVYTTLTGEWTCVEKVDVRSFSLWY